MRDQVKEIVEIIFNRWTALRLAVEHGMSKEGLQTAIDFVTYVTDSFVANPKMSDDDVTEILEDIMDQEFDTICDDNSVQEVSKLLVKYFFMLQNNQHEQIKNEFSQLPPCEMWIVPGGRVKIIANVDDGSSSSDDDEDMDTSESNVPSTSGSTMKFEVQEVDPDGWIEVKNRKKK